MRTVFDIFANPVFKNPGIYIYLKKSQKLFSAFRIKER